MRSVLILSLPATRTVVTNYWPIIILGTWAAEEILLCVGNNLTAEMLFTCSGFLPLRHGRLPDLHVQLYHCPLKDPFRRLLVSIL